MLDCLQLKSIHVIMTVVLSTLSHAVVTFLYAISYALSTIFFFLPPSPIHLTDKYSAKYPA